MTLVHGGVFQLYLNAYPHDGLGILMNATTVSYSNTHTPPQVPPADWIHFHTVENRERSKLDRK